MRNDIHHLFLRGRYRMYAYRESYRQNKTPQSICCGVRAHGSAAEAVFGVLQTSKGNKKMTAGMGHRTVKEKGILKSVLSVTQGKEKVNV